MLRLDPVALTDVGRKRDHNEDYLGDLLIRSGRSFGPEKIAERGSLFAVADGMGGHAAGEVASELAITTLFEQYYNTPTSGDIAQDLAQAVQLSNFQVHTAGNTSGRGQMGTTLTLALLKGNRALVGNVGDSRTYLVRQGVPLRVSHDHSLVQDQIDMGALTPEQAEHSAIRNVITRAIGHRDEVDADFFEQVLAVGDVLLLCSDGLHGLVKESEMGVMVADAPDLHEAAQSLIDLANERGGNDNISVVLIKILEVGEELPPLLPNQATTKVAFNGQTAPLSARNNAMDSGTSSNRRGKSVNEATDRFVPPPPGTTVSVAENRPTVKVPSPPSQIGVASHSEKNEKNELVGGRRQNLSWLIGLVLVLLIAGGLILYFTVFNSTPSVATPTPTVLTVPTMTSAVTTINVVTTVAGNGGGSNSNATPLPTVTLVARVNTAGAVLPPVTPVLGAAQTTSERSLNAPAATPTP